MIFMVENFSCAPYFVFMMIQLLSRLSLKVLIITSNCKKK